MFRKHIRTDWLEVFSDEMAAWEGRGVSGPYCSDWLGNLMCWALIGVSTDGGRRDCCRLNV